MEITLLIKEQYENFLEILLIGHNRYSTTGETSLEKYTTFFADLHMGGLSVAHNGNLTNALSLKRDVVKEGAIFRTTSDTETIVQLLAKSKRENF